MTEALMKTSNGVKGESGAKAAASAKAAPTRKNLPSRGIGDNSAANPDVDQATGNVLGGTFPEVTDVHAAVAIFNSAMVDVTNATREASYTALTLMFGLVSTIYEKGMQESFAIAHKIVAHGNATNPYQKYVRYFFEKNKREYVRRTVHNWSAIIAVAMDLKTDPSKFREWLLDYGWDNALDQSRALRVPSDEKMAEEESLADRILATSDGEPVCAATPLTKGKDGDRLAVIGLDPSGSGQFRVSVIFPHNRRQINKLLAAMERKNAAEVKNES